MKIAVFDTHDFEKPFLTEANQDRYELVLIETRLIEETAELARGCQVACIFGNDNASATVLDRLNELGVKFLALRSAGFNHVDLEHLQKLGMVAANVPAYSPYAVAEHTVALMLALNRKLIRAHNRIMELNFSLNGLVGFDMNGKTVGIVGLGKIGKVLAKIMHGFGCKILAYDKERDESLCEQYGLKYVELSELCKQSDIISLHLPLTPKTRYIINAERIAEMKKGVMLINTSRGALLNTKDVIQALKQRHIGSLGLDVYEEEEGLFFKDLSADDMLEDEVIARLMSFRNVLITSHQAFLTDTALRNIADTTFENIGFWSRGEPAPNELNLNS